MYILVPIFRCSLVNILHLINKNNVVFRWNEVTFHGSTYLSKILHSAWKYTIQYETLTCWKSSIIYAFFFIKNYKITHIHMYIILNFCIECYDIKKNRCLVGSTTWCTTHIGRELFFRLNSGVFILKNNFTEFYFLFPFLWSIVLCHQISLPIYRDLISEILTFAAHKMVYLYYNAGDAVSRINTWVLIRL